MNNPSAHFLLKEGLTFLNFGSFGATPKIVLQKYQALQNDMEKDPVDFITNTGLQLLKQSKQALADYIHCSAEDLVLVTNPSYAVNMVAKSLPLQPGDEVLASDLEYGACDKTWQFYCQQKQATYVRQPVSIPVQTKETLIEEFFKGVTKKTKLIFISHITSTTALIFPVNEICMKARQMGIPVFIDGAHVPGHIELNIEQLEPDYYTGACHKWMMAPKGCSFMYVKRWLQEAIDPLIVSWGYKALFPSNSRFEDYHQMNGTRDYTAFLTIPDCLQFMHDQQWAQVSANCKKLVRENATTFSKLLGSAALAPLNEDFIGQMYSTQVKTNDPEKLHDILLQQFNIQIPVMRQGSNVYLRYSINGFNSQKDLEKLFDAISIIKNTSSLIQ